MPVGIPTLTFSETDELLELKITWMIFRWISTNFVFFVPISNKKECCLWNLVNIGSVRNILKQNYSETAELMKLILLKWSLNGPPPILCSSWLSTWNMKYHRYLREILVNFSYQKLHNWLKLIIFDFPPPVMRFHTTFYFKVAITVEHSLIFLNVL